MSTSPDVSERSAASRPVETGTGAETRAHAWYAEFGPGVYRYFRFHVDSADTADDLTAETFLRLLEAAERYDPARADARVWVFTIARNGLRDHFRRTKVRKQVSVSALRDLASDAPSPEERLLRQEDMERLLRSVRELGESDRELISLRYGSDLGFAKIAAVLGMREAAVRTRLWRALAKLRKHLDREASA